MQKVAARKLAEKKAAAREERRKKHAGGRVHPSAEDAPMVSFSAAKVKGKQDMAMQQGDAHAHISVVPYHPLPPSDLVLKKYGTRAVAEARVAQPAQLPFRPDNFSEECL